MQEGPGIGFCSNMRRLLSTWTAVAGPAASGSTVGPTAAQRVRCSPLALPAARNKVMSINKQGSDPTEVLAKDQDRPIEISTVAKPNRRSRSVASCGCMDGRAPGVPCWGRHLWYRPLTLTSTVESFSNCKKMTQIKLIFLQIIISSI